MADRNPSPPPDITEELAHADTIGNTAYSKHWLFTLLMRVIGKVDEQADIPSQWGSSWRSTATTSLPATPLLSLDGGLGGGVRTPGCLTPVVASGASTQAGSDTPDSARAAIGPSGLVVEDLNSELERDLCQLWDMTVNKEVLQFLKEFEIIRIFTGAIACSRYPRLVEICIGILANMACDEDICQELTERDELIRLMIYMLNCRDPPTLVETARFLSTVLSSDSSKDVWLKAIRDSPDVLENMLFILQSSTSGPLLIGCVRVIEVIVREDDRIAEEWCTLRLLEAALEAQRQMEWLHGSEVEVFHRLFYIFSSNENGVVALIDRFSDIYPTISIYLRKVCEDEPHLLPLERYHNSMRAIVPILDVVTCNLSPEKALQVLQSDSRVLPCLVSMCLACSLNEDISYVDAMNGDLAVFFRDLLQITHKYLESSQGKSETVTWLPEMNQTASAAHIDAFLRSLLEQSSENRFFLEDLCCRLQLDSIQQALHICDVDL